MREIIADRKDPQPDEFTPVTPDRLWLWGGPTPSWGGSMAPDCLVREKSLGNENAIYVYGATTPEAIGMCSGYKKLLCQVNSNCRTQGMLKGSEEENAELLSKLSLEYPNITGAICDDFSTGFVRTLLPARYEKIYRGVKKYNDKLKLYGVVYTHELGKTHFDLIQPYIDVVNLWVWNKEEILDIDHHVAQCRKIFPGKSILLGLFIHDYGTSDLASPAELLIYQLKRAGVMLKKNWIEGVVVLGDREIRKWPRQSEALAKFLKQDQYTLAAGKQIG